MAELLVQLVNVRPDHVPGEVITVQEDGWPWSEYEQRLFLIVKCPQVTVAQASALLKDGVPDSVRQAVLDSLTEYRAAMDAVPPIQAKIDSALKTHVAAVQEAQESRWPPRLRYIDITAVPVIHRNRVITTWQKRSDLRATAKEAARARVTAFIEQKLGRSLTPAEQSLTTAEFLKRLAAKIDKWQADKRDTGKLDEFYERIITESRLGRESVENPEMAALPLPSPLIVTRAQLQANTLTVDAQAFHDAHPVQP